ncbi:unnamed protein product, partial [Symbiodinium sp. CCMP2456]
AGRARAHRRATIPGCGPGNEDPTVVAGEASQGGQGMACLCGAFTRVAGTAGHEGWRSCRTSCSRPIGCRVGATPGWMEPMSDGCRRA